MSKAIFWFRQDLRLEDNPALHFACQNHSELLFIYILPSSIHKTAQSWWLHHSLLSLSNSLEKLGLTLILKTGDPIQIIQNLIKTKQMDAVYWNRCYEPENIERDTKLKSLLKEQGIASKSFSGSLLNEPWEIKNQQGQAFKVFTPFWKQCLKQITPPEKFTIVKWPQIINCESEKLQDWNLLPQKPNWAESFHLYFQPGESGALNKLSNFINTKLWHYKNARNEPALEATSNLSPHLHFGEISPWEIYRQATLFQLKNPEHNAQIEHFLSELGWREFSYHLLYHFPNLPNKNFKSEFDNFPWQHNPAGFQSWTKGLTGYPIVDAGMRELWQTGTMHNRVRMIVASFLIKDLFIDWRKGAEWFNQTLLDADLANNSASWQWVAGSGADAAPYFRIFNPVLQGEKFDAQGHYVRKWVKELHSVPNKWIHHPWDAPAQELRITLGIDYPRPIVDHNQARNKALAYYQQIKDQRLSE
jgi:deoxyribodipyrimidine photo-lyase